MESSRSEYDVAVVGYGPVGQVLAALLGRAGHRVAVIERWPELYPRPRAAHFDHEIHRLLDRLGVLEEMGDDLVEMSAYDWRGADGELILHMRADAVAASGWPVGHLFYQPTLEAALHRRVAESPSVELVRGWAVTDLEQGVEAVDLGLERTAVAPGGAWRGTGERRRLRARYVVGADGANSLVRDAGGIALDDLGFNERWLVVDVAFDDPDQAERLFAELGDSTQWCDPRRPHMSARVGARHRRWEFMLLPGEDPARFAGDDAIWSMLAPWVEPGQARLERHVVYAFSSKLASTMRRGRVLLVGDAAHVMPPFIGQGLCSGLRDAANLAWKLGLVLAGGSDDRLLDTVTPERYGQNERTIGVSLRMGRVSCTLDAGAARERDAAFREGRTPPPEPMPGLEGGLRHRPGGQDSDPLAGTLGVQGRIADGQRSGLADAVVGAGWHLIARDGDPLAGLAEAERALLERLGAQTYVVGGGAPDAVADQDGRLTSWLEAAGVAAVLVRPDFYVFGGVERLDRLGRLVADLGAQLELPRPQAVPA